MVHKNKNTRNRWKNCDALVIDEISMLNGDILDKLEHVARVIRKNEKPFGGIQVCLHNFFIWLKNFSDSILW